MTAALTIEQTAAINAFAARWGKSYKYRIADFWGNEAHCKPADANVAAIVRGLRNTHGPAWLKAFKRLG